MSAKPWERPLQTTTVKKRTPALKKLRRFFEKRPAQPAVRANRKGEGFALSSPPRALNRGRPRPRAVAAGVIAAGSASALAIIILSLQVTAEFAILVVAMMSLGGVIFYDNLSRRRWENNVIGKLDELCARHDRLVRETARNRGDIAQLKEGIGSMAHGLVEDGRRQGEALESSILETIAKQLGAIGEKPRPAIGQTHHDHDILELEMTPPPQKPEPVSDLDGAINYDAAQFSDTVVTELVRYAVRHDRIDVFMQPIVSLPQRKARFHEVYARIRAGAGTYVPAQRYLEIARAENMLPAIDNLLLVRCLQRLRAQRGDGNAAYMLNISGATLNDRSFMNDLVAFLSQNHKMSSRLIFELAQSDLQAHSAAIAPVIDGLVQLGCRFSMDRVRHRTIDIRELKALNIRFIKLDAAWLLKEGHDKAGFSRIVRLKKQLDAAGIDLIIERIEDERVLRELLDYNIDYGQGFLFGKPDHDAAYREGAVAA